jgi:signal transduction histidine kinase
MLGTSQNLGEAMSDAASPEQITGRLRLFEAQAEASKSRLTKALHDDLGGLLGAAIMDTVWAEGQVQNDSVLGERLSRINQTLTKAVLLKRQVIEELCPTLIENVGLMAALRWFHRQKCLDAAPKCEVICPEREASFSLAAAKILFRIVEESLSLITRQPTAKSAHISLDMSIDEMTIKVTHDGAPMTLDERTEADLTSIWLVEHRVRGLGGRVTVHHPVEGGMELQAAVPLRDLLVA